MSQRAQYVLLVAGGIVVLLLLVAFGILPGGKNRSRPKPATIELWGFQDDERVMKTVLDLFKEQYPYLTVNYRQFNEATYEETLANRIAEGSGPDVFMLKSSQLTKHRDKIRPLGEVLQFTPDQFRSTFVDGAAEALVDYEGNILGVPIFMDSLALFYNRDLFNAAGLAYAPKGSWDDVAALAAGLTERTIFDEVTTAGLAIGSYRNVTRAFEIVSAMMYQRGDSVVNWHNRKIDISGEATAGFNFYRSFTDPKSPNFSWSAVSPQDIEMFAAGRAAMMVGLGRDVARVRGLNPHHNFSVVPLPQFPGEGTASTYADYFFPTAAKASRVPSESWTLALFLASREGAKAYLTATGLPPARRDLIASGVSDPDLAVFYRQALIARSWAVPDDRRARDLMQGAVESVNAGAASTGQALSRLRTQLELLLP